METFLRNIRISVRTLSKAKAFTIASLASLGLVMACNSVIFSAVYAALLAPLPFKDPNRLVMIWETNHGAGAEHASVAPTNFFGWQARTSSFDGMAALSIRRYVLSGDDVQQVLGGAVSSDFFTVLGRQPFLGRSFTVEEDQPGRNSVVILSYGLWQQRFGGGTQALGKSLTLNGRAYTVIGVMGPEFEFLSDKPELWVPLGLDSKAIWQEGRYLHVVARLRGNQSQDSAQTELVGIAHGLENLDPEKSRGWSVRLVPLYEEYVGDVRSMLMFLMAASLFVLLICCANISSLTLARVAGRESDVGVRLALGAGRRRLIMEMMTETLVLSLASGAVGLILAVVGTSWLNKRLADFLSGPRLNQIEVGIPVFAFTAITAMAVAFLIGLVPAILFSRADITKLINQQSKASSVKRGTRTFLNVLIGVEVAVSVMLLVGTGLMTTSLYQMQIVKLGVRTDHVLTLQMTFAGKKYDDDQHIVALIRDTIAGVRAIPSVRAVGAIDSLPLGGSGVGTFFAVQNRPEMTVGKKPIAFMRSVTPNYFEAVGTPLVRGRLFTDADDTSHPRVYIISEGLAKRFFPGEDPIGKQLILTWDHPLQGEIVGIVGDVRFTGLKTDPEVAIYWPTTQMVFGTTHLVVRSDDPPSLLVPAIRHVVYGLDNQLPLTNVTMLEDLREKSTADTRGSVFLLTLYSATALLLAAFGIFGVLSYTVVRRTREIGIRMALGAAPGRLMAMVLGQVLVPLGCGLVVGVSGAALLSGFIAHSLYGVKPGNPMIYAAVVVTFTLVAFVAALTPAFRAARVQPFDALRWE